MKKLASIAPRSKASRFSVGLAMCVDVASSIAPAFAATPAQEKAFVDGFKKAVERKDAKELKALLRIC